MSDLTLAIDVKKMYQNIELLSNKKNVIAMVKANSYGVGAELVEYLVDNGINMFGVTSLMEAMTLRSQYKDIDILIFTRVEQTDYITCIENNLTLVISNFDDLQFVDERINVHVKFDTGMGRLGISYDEVDNVKHIIESRDNVVGILSHLAYASNEKETYKQIELFKQILNKLNYDFKYVHLQNTFGSANYDLDFCNTVRLGIGMYGLYANAEEANLSKIKLNNVLSLNAKVIMHKQYSGYVGYDLTEYVEGDVSTIRIGYADGLTRSLQGFKFTDGSQIVGKISMCQTILKVANKQQEKEIFGNNESIYNLCTYANITTYELLVGLSTRIKRDYVL